MKQTISINIKNYGVVRFELREDLSPVNCKKFIEFVQAKLFDQRIIQRIAPNFVLQFTYDNYQDQRLECILPLESSKEKMVKGIVALGGDGEKISAPSDFFIVISDDNQERLNEKFTVIGKIIEGYEIIEQIIQVPTKQIIMEDAPNVAIFQPIDDIIVETIKVEE